MQLVEPIIEQIPAARIVCPTCKREERIIDPQALKHLARFQMINFNCPNAKCGPFNVGRRMIQLAR